MLILIEYRIAAKFGGEKAWRIDSLSIWRINRSANRLSIVSTNLRMVLVWRITDDSPNFRYVIALLILLSSLNVLLECLTALLECIDLLLRNKLLVSWLLLLICITTLMHYCASTKWCDYGPTRRTIGADPEKNLQSHLSPSTCLSTSRIHAHSLW